MLFVRWSKNIPPCLLPSIRRGGVWQRSRRGVGSNCLLPGGQRYVIVSRKWLQTGRSRTIQVVIKSSPFPVFSSCTLLIFLRSLKRSGGARGSSHDYNNGTYEYLLKAQSVHRCSSIEFFFVLFVHRSDCVHLRCAGLSAEVFPSSCQTNRRSAARVGVCTQQEDANQVLLIAFNKLSYNCI